MAFQFSAAVFVVALVLAQVVAFTTTASAQTEMVKRTDIDGDGKGDLVVYRNAGADAGTFYILQRGTNYTTAFAVKWGTGGTSQPIPADYDGDGRVDLAVYKTAGPDAGTWYILQGGSNFKTAFSVKWGDGAIDDVPVPADYDGDGRVDIAVWDTGGTTASDLGTWYILQAGSGYTKAFSVKWGDAGTADDYPVPRDYDGDGRVDLAVWDFAGTDAGTWYILQGGSNFTTAFSVRFGLQTAGGTFPSELAVPMDYDGDGKTDIAVVRHCATVNSGDCGRWYILQGGTGFKTAFSVQWGKTTVGATEDPAPGDYDGDGRVDIAYVKSAGTPDAGTWYILQGGTSFTTAFSVKWGNGGGGAGTDIALSGRDPQRGTNFGYVFPL